MAIKYNKNKTKSAEMVQNFAYLSLLALCSIKHERTTQPKQMMTMSLRLMNRKMNSIIDNKCVKNIAVETFKLLARLFFPLQNLKTIYVPNWPRKDPRRSHRSLEAGLVKRARIELS